MKVCIIGSGISGLYAGLLLKNNKHDITIFEKNKIIGGRIKNRTFDGDRVVAGAGIGRKSDTLLQKLCNDLNVPTRDFQSKSLYYGGITPEFTPLDKIKYIGDYMRQNPQFENQTFKEAASSILGKMEYKKLISYVGETDFEDEDAYDAVTIYGFDKSFSSGFTAFSIDWDAFLQAFDKLLGEHIKLNTKVDTIHRINDQYEVNGQMFDAIIIATTINQTKNLLSTLLPPKKLLLYDNIACQPFARVYAKLDSPLDDLQGYRALITKNPFQKIIEMNRDKCIYMISYSDNCPALFWLKKKHHLCRTIEKQLLTKLGISRKVLKSRLCFWNCGTHYFKPLPKPFRARQNFLLKVIHPEPNVYAVGEAFSLNQGWSEGALESVQSMIHYLR